MGSGAPGRKRRFIDLYTGISLCVILSSRLNFTWFGDATAKTLALQHLRQLRSVRRSLTTSAANSARPDLQSHRLILQQRPLRRLWSPLTSTPVGVKRSGTTDHQQTKVWTHPQHHARRLPLASCATTHPVQAVYIGQQVPSSHCAVVPYRHVRPGVGSIWSLVPTIVLAPRSLGSALSTDTVWTVRLLYVQTHCLELVAGVRPQPVGIIFFLSSAEDWTIR